MDTSELLWWQTAVIYQIYPRSFQDSNGDGVGDLPGITERLPYLAELGIDAIWISPFYTSPMADFGYDVADYTDVDPLFGTLDDFDELLATAHELGLKVIIDIVPNHTSDQHAWFLESRSSKGNPKRDWYVWRDAKPDGSPPNNWLSAFGGGAWEWDEATDQYYLHTFISEQPDLNWRNPEVVEAMHDVYRFWLDRGVDGFRIDVAHRIMKDPDLRDNPPKPGADGNFKSMGEYETQHHIHDMGHPDVHDVYRDVRAVVDGYDPPRVTIGEVHIFDWEEWVRYYGTNLDGMHMPFNFTLLYVPWDAVEVRARVDELEAVLPAGAWPSYVLGNHDEPRLATRFGPERARLAAMLLLTLRGTPTLYYGDEIGMTEVPIAPEDQQDPWAFREPELGRDGCRTPMQWDSSATAGFSAADPDELWLPLTSDVATVNVEVADRSDTSILTLYRRLLSLRRDRPALHLGSYAPIDGLPDGVFGFVRSHGSERLSVVLNLTDEPATMPLQAVGGTTPLISTQLEPVHIEDGRLVLEPNEGVVLGS